jgi:hypothetical protein
MSPDPTLEAAAANTPTNSTKASTKTLEALNPPLEVSCPRYVPETPAKTLEALETALKPWKTLEAALKATLKSLKPVLKPLETLEAL